MNQQIAFLPQSNDLAWENKILSLKLKFHGKILRRNLNWIQLWVNFSKNFQQDLYGLIWNSSFSQNCFDQSKFRTNFIYSIVLAQWNYSSGKLPYFSKFRREMIQFFPQNFKRLKAKQSINLNESTYFLLPYWAIIARDLCTFHIQ